MPASPHYWFRNKTPEQREIIFGTLFLTCWLALGTLGYSVLEQEWSLIDAFYMTFITLTTIGFNEVHDLSTTGRLFTIVFAIVGIGCVAFVLARWATVLIAGSIIRERQRAWKIRRMQDHYIICGYGRVGADVTAALHDANKPLVVLELDDERVHQARNTDLTVVHGDATHDSVLRSAGIMRARGLITLLPEDSLNVYVTLVARELNPHLYILARANDPASRRRILQAGASQVVAPAHVGATRIAQVILRPHVDRFISRVLGVDDFGLVIEQVSVEAGSFLAGKTLNEARFRQHFEAIVTCIIKSPHSEMHFNPGPHDRIAAGDILIVIGSNQMIHRLVNLGCSPHGTPDVRISA